MLSPPLLLIQFLPPHHLKLIFVQEVHPYFNVSRAKYHQEGNTQSKKSCMECIAESCVNYLVNLSVTSHSTVLIGLAAVVGCISCLSLYCPWHARSSMQKYVKKLKAKPFKLKVKSLCRSYAIELNRRHTKWNTWHGSHRETGNRTWACFWYVLLSSSPRTKWKKGHLPSACPATRAGR